MSPDYLKYFIAVCECGSIQAAARSLFISAQGLSQGIKRLETDFGVQLLERQPTGTVPTEFGRAFYAQACAAVRELGKLEELAERHRNGLRRSLVVGSVGRDKYSEGIPAAAAAYRRRFADAAFRTETVSFDSCEALRDAVRNGQADLGILFHSEMLDDFDYYPISAYSNVGLLVNDASPLAGKEYIAWPDLAGMPLIAAAETDQLTALVRSQMLGHGIAPQIAFTSTNLPLIVRLVSSGEAGILFRAAYCDEILRAGPNIVFRELRPEFPVTVSFISRTGRPFDRDFSAFRDYLIDYFKQIVIGSSW